MKFINRLFIRINIITIGIIILFGLSSCKKFIEVEAPSNSLTSITVFENETAAASVVTNLYSILSAGPDFSGSNGLSITLGLSADELSLWSGIRLTDVLARYKNEMTSQLTPNTWSFFYTLIYKVNDALYGISNSNAISPSVKNQLTGELYFLRAYFYFYLVNLYGDVPLVLTTNYKENSIIARTSEDLVWNSIVADLLSAKQLLSPNFLNADISTTTTERVRPTTHAASALLARVYLYRKNYDKAELESSLLLSNSLFSLSPDLKSVFLKNGAENIWQLQPVNSGFNTEESRLFHVPTAGPNFTYRVYLSRNLVNSFFPTDLRRKVWIDSVKARNDTFYYASKYKANIIPISNTTADITEYLSVFRLAEMYLIRAEARLKLNQINGAKSDLNTLRLRTGLPALTTNDPIELENIIFNERRFELFTEFGHRWLDLKRLEKIDVVMPPISITKGGKWDPFDKLFPISLEELRRNPSLIQNTGY